MDAEGFAYAVEGEQVILGRIVHPFAGLAGGLATG
jgi:hypothetical protein